MAAKSIIGSEFKDITRGEDIAIVDFWTSQYDPYMHFTPIYEKASEASPDITFARVDTEAEQELAGALDVSSISMSMVFRDNCLLCAPPSPRDS